MKSLYALVVVLLVSVTMHAGIMDWFVSKKNTSSSQVQKAQDQRVAQEQKCVGAPQCKNRANDGKCCNPNVHHLPLPPEPDGICRNGTCVIE